MTRKALPLVLLAGCTIGVDVGEPVQVVHTVVLTLPDAIAAGAQCDNLANLELAAFIAGGFCDKQQRAAFTCCGFAYNSTCNVSFCTKAEQFCVVVDDACQF